MNVFVERARYFLRSECTREIIENGIKSRLGLAVIVGGRKKENYYHRHTVRQAERFRAERTNCDTNQRSNSNSWKHTHILNKWKWKI